MDNGVGGNQPCMPCGRMFSACFKLVERGKPKWRLVLHDQVDFLAKSRMFLAAEGLWSCLVLMHVNFSDQKWRYWGGMPSAREEKRRGIKLTWREKEKKEPQEKRKKRSCKRGK